jgi:hypothetical protein
MKLRKITPKKIDNKRGQIQSFIFVIASIFAVAVVLFFLNHLFDSVYSELDVYFEDSKYNNTEAHIALEDYQTSTNELWDYVFLGLTMGYILLLMLTAFSTRIHPAFYLIYIVISLIGFVVGIMLSNTWISLAEDPVFSQTLDRFPITNLLLGSYYPTFMIVILVLFLIILFGKPPGELG